ncbi:bifunctional hydroxymethylpyrimidine kinase/phosphomethylpyrimidine kinase [Olsenella profusa]|uniref:pyridoxal kinase n=1 Tax=Olsenella profusa F0195 TaxID=1125712 RepID=U2USA0_9ACTN|nr:bifunctional hydroxymethylpyrimidine kinase/phosphomethylpyrimidine kinase [Olsenella profusa]ERL06002.1 putative pyridoxal kinase [Olsenella profusa F0195]
MTTAKELTLYQRSGAYIPRVAAVHDLCGYGNCSLGVAIPVLSAAGCDVCPIPTSLFSAHTGFPVFHMHDTTSMLDDYLDAWDQEGVELDAIYSGFLGSAEQVGVIERLYREHPTALRMVDPVMGDNGRKYSTYSDEMCEATGRLVEGADVLTPNLTEASILTRIPYEGQDVSDAYVTRMMDALLDRGAKVVVIKGVARNDGLIRNFVAGQDVDLDKTSGERLPFLLHGTGDLFASGLLAAIMCGRSLRDAVGFAGALVHDAMVVSREQPHYQQRGVSFESVLGEVTDLLR